MKIKQGFVKRKVANKWLVVAVGDLSREYSKMIELNETAAIIWDGVDKGLSSDKIVAEMVGKYGVSAEVAKMGVDKIIAQMTQEGIFE